MSEKLSKQESEKKINEFFVNIKDKKPNEIKKIKKLAMRYNIKLKDKKKLFCKRCFSVFNSRNTEIRIRKGFKVVKCKNCEGRFRFRIKN